MALEETRALDQLKNIGEILKQRKKYKLRIYGHADTSGRKLHNYKLSIKRAKKVYMYLWKNNYIPEYSAIYKGFGERRPVTTDDGDEKRKLNRRVEIIYIQQD